MTETQHPYSTLTPDVVLTALAGAGFEPQARIMPLNSYENRVYHVRLESGVAVVVKFYRSGRWTDAQIGEEHAFLAELAELEIPVAAPLADAAGVTLHHFHDHRFTVFPCLSGRQPDLDFQDNLLVMGRYLGRVHLAGARNRFRQRLTLTQSIDATTARNFLLEHDFIPAELRPAYESVSAALVARIDEQCRRLEKTALQRIHGDCHLGNVLWQDGAPQFVDFDDTVMGPVVQDLWMLLSGDRNQRQAQLLELVEGYQEFHSFPARQLELVESLRSMRIIHYAAWLARRWQDPAFPKSFPWFNTTRYWSEHILELREQQAALDEEPLRLA